MKFEEKFQVHKIIDHFSQFFHSDIFRTFAVKDQ